MANCCVNNLGRYSHNEIVDTFLAMSQVEIHKIHITSSNGNTFVLNKEIETIGDTIKFDVNELNENMVHDFTIEMPDGENYSYNECDKFRIQLIINTQINGCINPCDDDTDTVEPYVY